MPKQEKQRDYLTVPIHQSFYFNKDLELPTVIREYEELEKDLVDRGYLACITIQIENLGRIEYQYGSTVYHQLLHKVSGIISTLKEQEFREEDIFAVDLFDVDTFILFLSAPREKSTMLLDHLDALAERVRVSIKNEVFNALYPYFKVYSKPTVGYALVLRNPMVTNMRLIMQLVSRAKTMGEFLGEQQSYMSRFTLQRIIIEQKVETVFQPIVHMESMEIMGYEALSRGPAGTEFESPLLMFILAAEFGLSYELDTLCRKKALESAHRVDTDKRIFVNTLTMTIYDPEFRGAYLKQLLEDFKIKPENVVFELNEKLAIDNYDLFREAMKDYLDVGIVHASDDIGAGYSDLERIMELSPGILKIDINLVRDIDKHYMKQEIIKAMVSLSRGIGSEIVAEGVETKEEYRKLKELGITYGQGYLFAKPSAEPSETVNVRVEDLDAVGEPVSMGTTPQSPVA